MAAKPTILIVGGGYAGLFAMVQLTAHRDKLDVIMMDRKPFAENLPLLPDVVGKRVQSDNLRLDLQQFARRHGARFHRAAVSEIDPDRRTVTRMNGHTLSADYLLVCAGTETNYYGRDEFAANVPCMDTVADALKISRSLDKNDFKHVVVVGGGYTGVELITNVRRRLRLRRTLEGKTLHLVDRAPTVLPGLDERVRNYCRGNLERMGIVQHPNTTLQSYAEQHATLSSGDELPQSLVAWAAGVHTPACVRTLAYDRPQGRLLVAPTLQFADRCYAAGDAAGLERAERMLRPAVQFAISEGRAAARNILREIAGKEPHACSPPDLGFVVPMANFRACGHALGLPVTGRKAMFLHYFMCLYRSFGTRNRIGVVCDLLA